MVWLCETVGSDEQRFLEASMAYVSGNPILNDQEFDQLKLKLKVSFPLYFKLNRFFSKLQFCNSFCFCRWMVARLCARVQDAVSVVKR